MEHGNSDTDKLQNLHTSKSCSKRGRGRRETTHTHTHCRRGKKLDILHLVRHTDRTHERTGDGVVWRAAQLMATSIVQILCWQKSRRKERKKHEKHSTSCWHTYQALNRHLKVCYSCWQMSLHTHAHTHGYTLAPKSPQSASSSTACWPIKVARHLSSLSFFRFLFLGLLLPPKKKH